MKRIAYYLSVLALAVFTFTSCEDVPSPFGQIVAPKSDDVVVIEPSGKGTLDSPYNVAGVIEYLGGLGADVPSPNDVYIKGFITSITETFGTQYGNATFEISDTKDAPNKFLCYRVKYFGGQGYSDPTALNIKEGDEVIICGKVVNYKGNTPETSANAAYVYSINGTGGGTTPPPTETLGTKDAPLTVKQALEYINKLEDNGTTKEDAYVAGKITQIKTAEDKIAQYKNIDYIISDGTGEITVFRGKNIDNTDFTAAGQINVGDEVVVFGKLTKYVKDGNTTPEVAQGNYIVKLTKGSGGGGGGDAKGTGTASDPFNIAAAIAKCKEVGTTASTEKYYIKGYVVKGGKASGGYGNVTFDMGDTKDATELFKAYQVAGTDGEKLADGYEVPAGAEVVVYGPVVTYNTTYETAGKSAAQIVTINGKKTNEGGGGDSGGAAGDGSQSNPYNVAAITEICGKLGDKETSATDYYIKGKICSVKYTFSAQYGTATFNISDDGKTGGTEFTAYSVYYFNNAAWVDGNTQIAVGDDVVLFGKITNYGGTLETASKKACIYSLNGKTSDGGSGGGDTGGNEISVAASSFGLENGVEVGTQTLTDGTKLTFESGGNSNAPKYYTAGNGTIRMYPKNTMAIDAGSKKIASIEIVCNEYNGTLYNASGNVNATSGTKAVDGNSLKFTGINASSVTISNVAEGSGAATQIRLETLKITYAK